MIPIKPIRADANITYKLASIVSGSFITCRTIKAIKHKSATNIKLTPVIPGYSLALTFIIQE
jgi:hypothetical protein